MDSKSIRVQTTVAERLNNLCKFLDEVYMVNSGGCCYIAYCLARMLSRDKFKFKFIIYEADYPVSVRNLNELVESHYHYGLLLGDKFPINDCECFHDLEIFKTILPKVKPSEILFHYKACNWNPHYNKQKNDFIFKTIKVFYNDLTEDLREE